MFEGEFMNKPIAKTCFLLLTVVLFLFPQFTFSKSEVSRFPTMLFPQEPQEQTLPITIGAIQSRTIPAPSPGSCSLSPVQFEFSVPELDECTLIERSYGAILRADQNVRLYVRFGQRVAVENDTIIADFAVDSGETLERRVTIDAINNPSLRPGNYFIAISNCGLADANFTLTLFQGIVDFVAPIRVITRAEINGKKLLVHGCFPKKGAVLLLNGVPQKHTVHDEEMNRNLVIAKKAGALIAPQQTVTIQLQFPGNLQSNVLTYTRP
jgi:hypothetical protein